MCPCGLRFHKISFISSRTFFLKIIFGWAGSWLLHGPFSSCGKQGLLFIATHGLLIVGGLFLLWSKAPGHMGFPSCGTWALEHRPSSCGTWAMLLQGRWDLPRSGIEPVSPDLAGRFFSTKPPGKP